jgi:hypothetical protein
MKSEQVVFRDYPIWHWLSGVMLIVVGAVVGDSSGERLVIAVVGLAFIAFAAVLTVTVDRRRGILNLHYRSPLRASTEVYPFSAICLVDVAEDDERERMYRVELILQSGQVVPLRSWYTVGKWRKERRAQRLRSVLQ